MSMLDHPATELWKRPQGKPQGESDANAIYISVGIALSRWEALEGFLSMLFGYFVESPAQAATRAFGTLTSNQNKQLMMKEAAQIFFRLHGAGKESSEPLEILLQHYGQAVGRRNDIAHGMAMNFVFGDEHRGVFWIPPFYNSRNTLAFADPTTTDNSLFSQLKYRYTSEDISTFTGMFNDLLHETLTYYGRLADKYPQSQSSLG